MKTERRLWGVLWRSKNRLDGRREWLCNHPIENTAGAKYGLPALFATRAEATKWRDEHYGYIRKRLDLIMEPNGWKLPKVVPVIVSIAKPAVRTNGSTIR